MRIVALALLPVVASACGSADPPPQTLVGHVTLRDRAFLPRNIEVPSGTEVTWTNRDMFEHTVISGRPGTPDGRFDASLEAPGSAASVTLDAPGRYPFYCALHPEMTGEIAVRP